MGKTNGLREQIGVGGHVNGHDVLVIGDTVLVERGGETVARRTVAGFGRFVGQARDLRPGWGQLPDFEVLYLYAAMGSATPSTWTPPTCPNGAPAPWPPTDGRAATVAMASHPPTATGRRPPLRRIAP